MDQFSIYLQRELKVIIHTQQQETPLSPLDQDQILADFL